MESDDTAFGGYIPQRPLMMRRLFRFAADRWNEAGKPFASTARWMRHGFLKPFFPLPIDDRIAVIIPCHNYGQYLSRAIDSVLNQTLKPAEILVVDDASTDDTAEIAARYADRGVSYLRVENRNLAATRNSGAAATVSPFLMYLDADDYLDRHYIRRCLDQFDHHNVGLAYGDMQEFGEGTVRRVVPPFDVDQFTRSNYIGSHALIRRQAFDLVGGYRVLPTVMEDWDFYRRVIHAGFTARKAKTHLYYNVHHDSMLQKHVRSPHYSYINDAALLYHPITIFTPFNGRLEVLDAYLAGLRSLDIDPAFVHLFWYNTSDDEAFDQRLRKESATLPFASVRYMHDPLPEIWRHTTQSLLEGRIGNVRNADYYYQLAVVRAYNTMIASCTTEYALTLEDDNIVESDTLKGLLGCMKFNTAAVIAPYRSRFFPRYEVWDHTEKGGIVHRKEKGTGVEEVGGCGFGCTLFRMSALKAIAPLETGVNANPKQWYDQISYTRLAHRGTILCDWNHEVGHAKSEAFAGQLDMHFT